MNIKNLFEFDIENKKLIIIISSIIWAINFRSSFKNIDIYMDSGSYASLKYDTILIMQKNILCCFFFLFYYLQIKLNKSHKRTESEIIKTNLGDLVTVEVKEKKAKKNSFIYSIFFVNKIINSNQKIVFSLKNFVLIIIIYICEEAYFIIANNHILDITMCPIRNIGNLISILIFSPILLKNSFLKYRHQFIPFAIIFILSASLISFDIITVDIYKNIYRIKALIIYIITFILMGFESVIIKYLVDCQFISMFLILGLKGIIGTCVFCIINIRYSKIECFNFIDDFLYFKYEEMFEIFEAAHKSVYILSLISLQYLKVLIINRFSENHILSTLMITDIIYFPFYCIERFYIQRYEIINKTNFILNVVLGFINFFLMLIFNEVLECKFWGLNTNLKNNINKRQINDIMISLSEVKTNSSITDEEVKEIECITKNINI